MSKFIVKPKKTASEYDFIEQESEIFKRGRYGKHIQVGAITKYKGESVQVRFDKKIIPVSQAVLQQGQGEAWFEYKEKKEPVIFYMSDVEAAKFLAENILKVTILNGEKEQ